MGAKHDMALTGAELIAAERERQIKKERWTAKHDDQHDDSSLLLAAICYAAPERVYLRRDYCNTVEFRDPWPDSWAERWDKRGTYGDGAGAGNGIADPATYTPVQRLDLLVKAGALSAAEIDRQKRALGVGGQFDGRNGNGYQPLPRPGPVAPPPRDPNGVKETP